MFKFFRKKKKENQFGNEEIYFFKNLIDILPKKYSYLSGQINNDFILGFKENILGFKDSYTFLLNANLEALYTNKRLPHYFILKNINVWNTKKNSYCNIELDILSGMIGGFKSESIDFLSFDFSKTDIENITEKNFENKDLDKLLMNFDENEKKILSKYLDSTYAINLPDGVFYYIDDIGNGDVLALDKIGNAYLLTHDPAQTIRIFSKEDLFEKLENNTLIKEATKIYDSL
ncbi:hypothetical protein [Flavobacterium piscis]|uniref:SMI1/KNR4 family protein n=1 Tax=Flavobacterium piscis TaxID=1114874 RepID=A0ABU1YES5_9FLAO|nr:hypothetical protein [Flavobacterium piscis]MDR7212737.1 hypothetical protein [Flavobacterium piscis]